MAHNFSGMPSISKHICSQKAKKKYDIKIKKYITKLISLLFLLPSNSNATNIRVSDRPNRPVNQLVIAIGQFNSKRISIDQFLLFRSHIVSSSNSNRIVMHLTNGGMRARAYVSLLLMLSQCAFFSPFAIVIASFSLLISAHSKIHSPQSDDGERYKVSFDMLKSGIYMMRA